MLRRLRAGVRGGGGAAMNTRRAAARASDSAFLRTWSAKVREMRRVGDMWESDDEKIKAHLTQSVSPGRAHTKGVRYLFFPTRLLCVSIPRRTAR